MASSSEPLECPYCSGHHQPEDAFCDVTGQRLDQESRSSTGADPPIGRKIQHRVLSVAAVLAATALLGTLQWVEIRQQSQNKASRDSLSKPAEAPIKQRRPEQESRDDPSSRRSAKDTKQKGSSGNTSPHSSAVASSAKIVIQSNPARAVVMTPNGKRALGRTPLGIVVKPGHHEFLVTSPPAYSEKRVTVDVGAGEIRTIAVDLRPNTAKLYVTSDPPGAEVYLDGTLLGATPLRVETESFGVHKLRVRSTSREKVHTIILRPGGVTRTSVRLDAGQGYLSVDSVPAGAAVVVDGSEKGRTPLSRVALSEGKHNIRVVFNGRGHVDRVVEIRSGQSSKITITVPSSPVIPRTGTLVIVGPLGARVFVDGSFRGSITNERGLVIILTVGLHAVEVRHGQGTWSVSISVTKGAVRKVEVPVP